MGLSLGMSKAEEEAALKEKRTRRNRDKKVKKKQRERLKKTSLTDRPGWVVTVKFETEKDWSKPWPFEDCIFGYARATQDLALYDVLNCIPAYVDVAAMELCTILASHGQEVIFFAYVLTSHRLRVN